MSYSFHCRDCDEEWNFAWGWFNYKPGRFLDIMERAGMGYRSEHGPWPDLPPVTDEEIDAGYEHPDEVKFLTWAGCEERPGIPFHKMGSNDAWRIRRDECQSALDAWKVNGFPTEERFGDLLMALLHGAQCNGLEAS